LRRYPDFCDFQDGGCRRLGLSKIRNFKDLSPAGVECASPWQISSKSVERLRRYGIFSKWRPSAFLDFVGRVFGQPTKTTFGIAAVLSIIMKVLIFFAFGYKTPIHAPKLFFGGI